MKLSDLDNGIIEILGESTNSTKELSDACNANYNTIRTHLKKLERYKLIEMQEGKLWTLTDEGKSKLNDKKPVKTKKTDKYFGHDPYISRVRGFNILQEYCNSGYGDGLFGDMAIENFPDDLGDISDGDYIKIISHIKRRYRVISGLELLGADENINPEVIKNNPVLMLLVEELIDDIKGLYPEEKFLSFLEIDLKRLVSEKWFSMKI